MTLAAGARKIRKLLTADDPLLRQALRSLGKVWSP